MKASRWIALLSIAAMVLTGCGIGGSGRTRPTIRYTIGSARSVETIESQPNRAILVNLTDVTVERLPIEDFESGVPVDPDSTYVLGVVHEPEASAGVRSLGTAITTLGNINIAATDLDTLPVGADSAGIIDLGDVASDGEVFVSGMSAEDAEIALGHDQGVLSGLGFYDQQGRILLNVDINQNGTYDADEGLSWGMFQRVVFHVPWAAVDQDTTELAADGLESFHDGSELFFIPNSGIEIADPSDVALVLPQNSGLTDDSGSPITEITDPSVNSWDVDDVGIQMYIFFFNTNPPTIPSGDFQIRIGAQTFALENLAFPNPYYGYEGFIYPIVTWDRGPDGEFTTIRWRWYMVTPSGSRSISAEEVRIKAPVPYIYIGPTGQGYAGEILGTPLGADGSVDVTSLQTALSDGTATGIRMGYKDLFGNDMIFWFFDEDRGN